MTCTCYQGGSFIIICVNLLYNSTIHSYLALLTHTHLSLSPFPYAVSFSLFTSASQYRRPNPTGTRKPAVPARSEAAPRPEQKQKDFVTANAVEAILAGMSPPAPHQYTGAIAYTYSLPLLHTMAPHTPHSYSATSTDSQASARLDCQGRLWQSASVP